MVAICLQFRLVARPVVNYYVPAALHVTIFKYSLHNYVSLKVTQDTRRMSHTSMQCANLNDRKMWHKISPLFPQCFNLAL